MLSPTLLFAVVLAGILLGAGPVSGADVAGEAVCEKVRRIWNEAPHNAFTDLTRFRGRWICVFREGRAHVSPDGAVRVLVQIPQMPGYHEQVLVDSLARKLRADYGDPPKRSPGGDGSGDGKRDAGAAAKADAGVEP